MLEILEKNYATFCALNGQEVDPAFSLKDKVLEILEETGNSEARSGKMDQDEFLKLLIAFNKVGIHFA